MTSQPKDIYRFLSETIATHSELKHWTAEELKAKETDFDFWEELGEHLDCLRVCDVCHRPMIEGYCIDDGQEHYCSDECLNAVYTDEDFEEMCCDGEGTSYWTVWWE